ncbi:MAG TPA: Asd/ArgC dimerization domain-containing protein [Terriglobales bacterium]|nr:Asd/ArgC dimerization domain-containing protein [Terriglobales bacterium]
MSSSSKSTPAAHDLRGGNAYRVAIVGAASLKGKEVAEVLNDRNFPALDVKLLDDDESLGQLEAMGDEISFIQKVRAEQFDKVDFTFFASDPECTRKNWKIVQKAGSAIVDLSFALEDDAEAAVRSPWIERQLAQMMLPELQPGPVVIAHPAAVVLALLVLRAQKAARINRLVATIFEPASEHGQKGMDELHEQTVNLLSFQQLPKNIFDTQVAFNLVARYGEKSHPPLDSVEQRILKHYDRIAGRDVPRPSLLLLQAPIFHGHAFAIYLEMESPVALGDLAQALSGDHVAMARGAEEAPSNVNAAGQGDILVSVSRDSNHENGLWLWVASDNLRIAALTAVECAETMAATRPRGKIQ